MTDNGSKPKSAPDAPRKRRRRRKRRDGDGDARTGRPRGDGDGDGRTRRGPRADGDGGSRRGPRGDGDGGSRDGNRSGRGRRRRRRGGDGDADGGSRARDASGDARAGDAGSGASDDGSKRRRPRGGDSRGAGDARRERGSRRSRDGGRGRGEPRSSRTRRSSRRRSDGSRARDDAPLEPLVISDSAGAGPIDPTAAAGAADDAYEAEDTPTYIGHDDPEDAPPRPVVLAPDLPADPQDDPDPVTCPADADADADADHDADFDGHGDPLATVKNVIGVKFSSAGRIYPYAAGDGHYERGETVVVETEHGTRIGHVAVPGVRRPHTQRALRRVLRRPNASDERQIERTRDRARDMLLAARDATRELGLPIKVYRAEPTQSGRKVLIYFTADERVDFRALVRNLSSSLRCRVEMRQTGVRDEAKMLGGIGSCGRELCCTTWLPEFVPVSIKMAKDQGLVLNPTKVSGQCGRLKCCLVYEQDTYAALRKGLPKLGKRVVTGEGEGRVVEVDVLGQRVRVTLTDGQSTFYAAGDVTPMFPSQRPSRDKGGKSGKSRRSRGSRDADRRERDESDAADADAAPAASDDAPDADATPAAPAASDDAPDADATPAAPAASDDAPDTDDSA